MKKDGIKLWKRDFSAFAAGMFLEYMSTAGMSFVLSLLILDITKSVLLYGTYLVLYYMSSVFVPMLAGPLFEKYSKKKINSLCCVLSAAVYGGYLILYIIGKNHIAFTFLMAVLTGIFHAAFSVGANALMLDVTEKESLQKAYSVFNVIETCSEITVPIVTVLYKSIGLEIILFSCVILFFVAAGVLLLVKNEHTGKSEGKTSYAGELRDGLKFVNKNRAYLTVCTAFLLCFMMSGVRRTVWLPYFQNGSENSYLWYFVMYGLFSTGLFHSSLLMYFRKTKKNGRYLLSVVSFAILCAGTVGVIFVPKIGGAVLAYFAGLSFGIFSNTSSVSVYAELDEGQRARFSGIFTAFTNAGIVVGMASASVLSEVMDLRGVIAVLGALVFAVFAVLFFGIRRKGVKKLYYSCSAPCTDSK
ncbi:MAG: MFS transporter [Ruminococcus sp.]|nr:MFS transporter [Candidatus Copronaster equi]